MNKKLLVLVCVICLVVAVVSIVLAASPVERREYVLLEFKSVNGELELISKSLETGFASSVNHDVNGDYEAKLVSDSDVLSSVSFNPEFLYSDSFQEGQVDITGDVIILEETEFFVSVPSVESIKKVEVYKNGDKILEEDIYDVGATSCRIK